MNSLIVTLLLVTIFYLLIPGLGAFYTRSRWRIFRKRILRASLFPHVSYGVYRTSQSEFIGNFRFFGYLEAIQEDRIWVRNREIALSADLAHCSIYVLPSLTVGKGPSEAIEIGQTLPDEEPRKIPWSRIFSLPEGTKIFIGGPLFNENGRSCFRNEKNNPLTVVIYDGAENGFLQRSIWTGRQKNEYWNLFTPGSLTAGSFSLFIQAYILLREPLMRLPALVSLTASLLPVIVFIPPGILFFFLYRRLWHRGRYLRAERDLFQLPLRYFPDPGADDYQTVTLPDGETLAMLRKAHTSENPFHHCAPGVKLRSSNVLQKDLEKLAEEHYIFGKPDGSGNPVQFTAPRDPMAEFLVVPGNPAELSAQCAKRAHLFELTAGVVFGIGMLFNIVLVFALFTLIIK
jgi:hypothetical protein